jgi:response regulator of citrate/malate metabolism
MAKRMHKNHGMSIDDICKTLNISRASFYRYLTLDESKRLIWYIPVANESTGKFF